MALRPRPPRAWLLLRERHGGHVLDPSEARRAEALRELFHPDPDDAAPGECSLELGRDGGPMLHLVFTHRRDARFEEWVHVNRHDDVLRLFEASRLSDEEALELWSRLAAEDVDAIRRFRWRPG